VLTIINTSTETVSWKINQIAKLATQLPAHCKEEVLTEALNLARTIKNRPINNENALISLCPHLSRPMLEELLAIARERENRTLLVSTIINLARYPTDSSDEKMSLLNECLETIETLEPLKSPHLNNWEGFYQRADLLSNLTPYLTEPLQQRALEICRNFPRDFPYRINFLINIARSISEQSLHDLVKEELLAMEQDNRFKEDILMISLIAMLPYLPLDAVLKLTMKINSQWNKVTIMTELARYHSSYSSIVLNNALKIAETIEVDYRRVESLTELLPYLDNTLKVEVLKKAVEIVLRIEDQSSRTNLLANLASLMTRLEIPVDLRDSLFRDTLDCLSRNTRKELLKDLCALTDVIFSLGGVDAIEKTASAILDVGRWWF
jgi:hypothetical protein